MKDKVLTKATLKKGVKLHDVMPASSIEKIFKAAIIPKDVDVFILDKVDYESGNISITIQIKTK